MNDNDTTFVCKLTRSGERSVTLRAPNNTPLTTISVARAKLLGIPTPPEPIKVGDRVRTRISGDTYKVLAINDRWAWCLSDRPYTIALNQLHKENTDKP